jgi:hypothetical protein
MKLREMPFTFCSESCIYLKTEDTIHKGLYLEWPLGMKLSLSFEVKNIRVRVLRRTFGSKRQQVKR